MTRRLYTESQIFFPNPYVLRVDYPTSDISSVTLHRQISKKAYKLINGTWGYTPIVSEHRRAIDGAIYDMEILNRAYFVFKDEIDALQFRLSLTIPAIHVFMWPKDVRFLIHEVTEDDES